MRRQVLKLVGWFFLPIILGMGVFTVQDKVVKGKTIECKGYTYYRTQPQLEFAERRWKDYIILGKHQFFKRAEWEVWWVTKDPLDDIKTIYQFVIPRKNWHDFLDSANPWNWLKIELNTVQPKHEEYNITKYPRHIFNLATFDKTIVNYDQGIPLSWDRAAFWIQANMKKLPGISKVSSVEMDKNMVKDYKTEFIPISNEELLSGKYDERTVLPVLEARGIKEKPRKFPVDSKVTEIGRKNVS